MAFELRSITPDEFEPFMQTLGTAFGDMPRQEILEHERHLFEFHRSLATFEDGRIVGTAGAYSFQLTLPGLTTMPVAGVTAVGVLPTHRRRGILNGMMRRQLEDVRERGEPAAILMASETVIYGRYGYGRATESADLEIDKRFGSMTRVPETPGQVSLVDREAALKLLPDVYDRFRRQRPAAITRSAQWWKAHTEDAEWMRRGAGARFHLVYESTSGQIDGYLMYRVKEDWKNNLADFTLRLTELVWTTPEAYTALWSYIFNVDLVTRIEANNRPVDEPVRWLLADSRRLRTTELSDFLWLRPVDVSAALRARRYNVEGRIVFDLVDPFCPDNNGRYSLEGSPDGADCRRTDAEADIALQVTDLGAVYLGGTRFSTLHQATRIDECRPGAVRLADAMFASSSVPWCHTGF